MMFPDRWGTPDSTHVLVDTGQALTELEESLSNADRFGWDCETTGLRWYGGDRVIGWSFAVRKGRRVVGYYVPCGHVGHERQLPKDVVVEFVDRALTRKGAVVVGHNLKFDFHFAEVEGVGLPEVSHDTMIQAHLLDADQPLKLEKVVSRLRLFKDPFHWAEKVQEFVLADMREYGLTKTAYLRKFGYSNLPLGLATLYAANDARFALRLHEVQSEEILAKFKGLYLNELRLLRVILEMERNGLAVSESAIHGLREDLQAEADRWRAEIARVASPHLDPAKDREVSEYLFGTGTGSLSLVPEELTAKAKLPAVHANALEALAAKNPQAKTQIDAILGWRGVQKAITTYTESILGYIDDSGLIHCDLRQTGAATGRVSCRNPNLQNIPARTDLGKRIRRCFKVPEGFTRVFMDYSQIELRMIAWFVLKTVGDTTLAQAYIDGEDIHTKTAMDVWGDPSMRSVAKIINFGLSYGMSPVGMSKNRSLGLSFAEAEEAYEEFQAKYGFIFATKEIFFEHVRATKGQIYFNPYGRRRSAPNLVSPDAKRRGAAERASFGGLIQGTAADAVRFAMVRAGKVLRRYEGSVKFVQQIHDEVTFDVPTPMVGEFVADMRPALEDNPKFAPIPVTVGVEASTTNWAEKSELEES